jgi:crossover junction endodeoxyribonuclease RuvC
LDDSIGFRQSLGWQDLKPKLRLLGIDPGLRYMGWGVIDMAGNHLSHVANGVVTSNQRDPLSQRLVSLYDGLTEVLSRWQPDQAAVEKTFVSKDAVATLKLGHARAIALLLPAQNHLPVAEYAPNLVKKTVVGNGHADKRQIRVMVKILLPTCEISSEDAADALAIAICHAHHMPSLNRLAMSERDKTAAEIAK